MAMEIPIPQGNLMTFLISNMAEMTILMGLLMAQRLVVWAISIIIDLEFSTMFYSHMKQNLGMTPQDPIPGNGL